MTSLHHSPRHGVYRTRTDLPSQTSRCAVPSTRSATYHGDKERLPWEHMTRTCEWVLRHEYTMFDERERKTEQWIMEQQIFRRLREGSVEAARVPGHQEKLWEDKVYFAETQAKRAMRQEEIARQKVGIRARHFEEETERIEARIRYKLDMERRKLAEEKRKAYEEMEKRKRQKTERLLIVEKWKDYEEGWSRLMTSSDLLGFSSIPWPVVAKGGSTEEDDIEPWAISSFLLSPMHSVGQTQKERIRSAQLRWHPDRFLRVLRRVKEEEKETVKKCVGIIARCLNEWMIM